MAETKPFASLSSGLLARKGAAKPAMRPQGFGSFGSSLEDLGWNDMGPTDEPAPHHVPSPVTALTPAPARLAPEPAVVVHQRALAETYAPDPQAESPVVTLPRRRGEVKTGNAKAAFTLRLDPERHLKLRLACALSRQSAQMLVTGALDEFLNSIPELDGLADRVPAEPARQRR